MLSSLKNKGLSNFYVIINQIIVHFNVNRGSIILEKCVEKNLNGITYDQKIPLMSVHSTVDLRYYQITDIEKLSSKLKTIKYRPTGRSAYDELEARFKSIKELNDEKWEDGRTLFAIWTVFGDLINKKKEFVHVEILDGTELSEYGLAKT